MNKMWFCFDSVAMTLGSWKIFSCFLNLVNRWEVFVQMLNAGIFSPNIVYACWEDAFMGCEWKYHVSQHFVKYMKHHQKSSFLICGRISECIICFPLWDGFYFSSCDFCSWIFFSMGQACTRHGMKIMRPDLPGAQVILCITCFQSLQTCLIAAWHWQIKISSSGLCRHQDGKPSGETEVGWGELVLEFRKMGCTQWELSKTPFCSSSARYPMYSEWS